MQKNNRGIRLFSLVMTAFLLCSSFSVIGFAVDTVEITEGSCTYRINSGQASLYSCVETASGEINIPSAVLGNSVTGIDDYAFFGCTLITSVTVPETVKEIGKYAFAFCTSLTSVSVPSSVTLIGENAFQRSSNVTISCEAGSYAEEYAKNNGVSVNEKCFSKIEIEGTVKNVFVGSKFAVSASFVSEKYSPSSENISWSIERLGAEHDDGIILNGSLSCLGTKDNGIISLPLKAVKEGIYSVTFSVLDGATDTALIHVTLKQYPSGYFFSTDRYWFENLDETIDSSYYTGMYGDSIGNEFYRAFELDDFGNPVSHGHCFGMAVTTASTLLSCPDVTDYFASSLSKVNPTSRSIDLNMTARDYIKYGHISQYCTDYQSMRGLSNYDGIENVYEAVADYVVNDGEPVIIDLFGGRPDSDHTDERHAGHTVYPIGIDETGILVNDSNEPGTVTRINIDGDAWSYTGGGWYWGSDIDCTINYDAGVIAPYLNLKYAVDLNESIYAKDMTGMKLLAADSSYTFSQDDLIEIKSSDASFGTNQTKLYWMTEGHSVIAQKKTKDQSEIRLADENSKVAASIPEGSSVELKSKTSSSNSATISDAKNEEVTMTFYHYDGGHETSIKLAGKQSGSVTNAVETSDGVSVIGLKDATITLETDGKRIEKTADEENFRVVLDEDGQSFTTVSSEISVVVSDLMLTYRTTAQLKSMISADSAVKYSVSYQSTDPKVASVDQNGNVTGAKKGTATITVIVADEAGNIATDTCKVTVNYTWWQWLIRILLFGWLWY